VIELQKEELTIKREKAYKKAAVKIAGMTCTSCAQSIEKALTKAKGVSTASVNFATETAYVEYDDAITSEKEFEKVIKDTGYDVYKGTKKIILRIGGMTCASCSQTIEKALRKLDGVEEANVNLATEKATVVYNQAVTDYEKIKTAVEDSGYQVLGREDARAKYDEEAREIQVFETCKKRCVSQ